MEVSPSLPKELFLAFRMCLPVCHQKHICCSHSRLKCSEGGRAIFIRFQCVQCWMSSNDPKLVRPLRHGSAEHSDGLAHSTSLDCRLESSTSMVGFVKAKVYLSGESNSESAMVDEDNRRSEMRSWTECVLCMPAACVQDS